MALIIVRSPSGPVILTSSLPAAQVGSAYNAPLSATGGSGNYQWTLTSVTGDSWGNWLSNLLPIPSGGYVLPSAALTGTPAEPGSAALVIGLFDIGTGQTAVPADLTITVNDQ